MIRFALIGAGTWGRNFIKTIKEIPGCEIKYVCATSDRNLKSLPNKYIKLKNYKKLLEVNDVDGVIIATNPLSHFKIAKDFLKKGFNLLIEKPLTTNYKDALQLKKTWKQKKSKVLVGHTFIYNPGYIKIKSLLTNLGKVKTISFEGLGSSDRKDVSIIWDWGPHAISIIVDLFNNRIKNIKSDTYSHDQLISNIRVSLIHENGVEITLSFDWKSIIKKRLLIITCERGVVSLDDIQKKIILVKDNEESFLAFDNTPPLTMEVNEFISSLTQNTKIHSDLEFGVKVIEILQKIENSLTIH